MLFTRQSVSSHLDSVGDVWGNYLKELTPVAFVAAADRSCHRIAVVLLDKVPFSVMSRTAPPNHLPPNHPPPPHLGQRDRAVDTVEISPHRFLN